jgi:photosystem II stability/assembly factor-like uncharacterized protein
MLAVSVRSSPSREILARSHPLGNEAPEDGLQTRRDGPIIDPTIASSTTPSYTVSMVGVARSRRSARQPLHTNRQLVFVAALVLAAVGFLMYGPLRRSNPPGAIAKLETADFHALAFSPDDPNVVFFGHHNGVLRSDDGGRAWRPLVERRDFDAMSLAVPQSADNRLYMAGHDVFQSSTDGGVSWQPVSHNLPGTDIHAFTISPDVPTHVFASVVGYGLFQSLDGGQTWTKLSEGAPPDVTALASVGGNPESLLVGSGRAGVVRSSDGGQSWLPSSSGMNTSTVLTLAVDPASRQKVYAGGPGGV